MTTHGPFSFPSATTGDVDRFIYDSVGQSGASLPAASDTDQNICWAQNRTPGRSTGVGPDYGQEGAEGGFLYSECSAPGANGDIYTLEFDTVLNASAEQWQFNFYRMQRGPAIGNNQSTMTVQINEGDTTWVDVSSELGGTGNDVAVHDWGTEISIDLSESGANTDSSTQVRIRWVSQAATTWWADVGVDTIEIIGTPSAAYEQEGSRFRDDDDDEANATWLELQDVDLERGKEINTRLRILTDATGNPETHTATLQYRKVGDAATEWRDIPL